MFLNHYIEIQKKTVMGLILKNHECKSSEIFLLNEHFQGSRGSLKSLTFNCIKFKAIKSLKCDAGAQKQS